MTTNREKWFTQLASLSYPQNPAKAAEAFLVYMPLLTGYPESAFTVNSLEEVMTNERKMSIPSYDEVRKVLRAHSPLPVPRLALRAPERVPSTAEEIAAVTATVAEIHRVIAANAPPAEERPPTKPAYLTDEQLLALNERLATDGNGASAMRAAALRARLGRRAATAADRLADA